MKNTSKSTKNTTLRENIEKLLSRIEGSHDPDSLIHELEVHQIELEMQNEELRRAQQQIEESGQKYLDLYDFAPVGYLTLNGKGIISEINLTAASLLGRERKFLVNKSFHDLIKPELQDVFYFHRRQVLKSSTKQSCELVLKRNEGTLFHAQLESIRVESNGEPAMRTILMDITERKQIEDELKRYQLLARHGRDIILFVRGSDGSIVEANDAAVKAYGYTREELLSLCIYDLRGPKGYLLTYSQMDEADSSGVLFETEHRRKDGKAFAVEVSSRGISIGSERVLLSVIRDISERKQIEKALQESEEHGKKLYHDSPIPTFTWRKKDNDFILVDFNQAADQITDGKSRDFLGSSAVKMYENRPHILSNMHLCFRKRSVVSEEILSMDFAPGRFLSVTYGFIAPDLVIVHLQDQTERRLAEDALRTAYDDLEQKVEERTADLKEAHDSLKSETARRERMEERIRHSEKMEAIGTLAGGIAHDFNNMLAAVIGFTEMAIEDNTPGNKAVDRAHKHVLKAAFRGRDLVKQILAFSRRTQQEIIPFKLTPLIKETVQFLKATLPSTVKIEVKIKGTSDTVLADPSQVQQVVMNLCTNAGFAMREKGGRLTITLHDADGSTLPSGLLSQPYLLMSIKDTGTGIEPDVLKRIFEPFFTTKEKGQGTGMGLAVVYGIVKSLRGDLTVESEPGKGTIFNVFIPQAHSSVQLDEIDEGELPHGTARILFIDDEESLVILGRSALRRLGYKVVGVTDSNEALFLFLDNPGRFDLVIADQTMPGVTGMDLAKELVKARPDIPIILCTGYSDNACPETAREAGVREFLMKPLTRRELAEAVHRVLATKKEG